NRRATARQSHEETFELAEGFEILGAVRPLSEGRTGWWFTPRIAAPKVHSPAVDTHQEKVPVTLGGHTALFQEAPIGIAMAECDGTIREANRTFREFFAAAGEIKDRPLQELAPPSEAASIGNALARSEANSNIVLTVHTQGERLAEIHLRPLSRN